MPLSIEETTVKNYTSRDTDILVIPETVTDIGSFSIDNHPELKQIHIPKTIQKIGYHSFYECDNLENFRVDRKNKNYSEINGVLYNKKQTAMLYCPNGREEIYIPASVTEMRDTDTFAGCKKLKKITVDKKNRQFIVVDGILYQHDGCQLTKLIRCPVDKTSVHIPESVTGIYNHAFEGCNELEEITLPDRIKFLQGYTFKHCHNLKRVHFPKFLTSIGDSCFRECWNLEEVVLPYGLKNITAAAFTDCRQMKKLVIPATVDSVGYIAFDCSALEYLECHGITVDMQKYRKYASQIIWIIVEKRFYERIPPELEYQLVYRLFLINPDHERINSFIRKEFDTIITRLIIADEIQLTLDYLKSFRKYIRSENLDTFIRCAIENQRYELQIYLTNMKYQRNDFTEKDWTL